MPIRQSGQIEIDYDKVIAALEGLSRNAAKSAKVQVGYTARYAVYVHEDLETTHKNGEAKFLEKAARKVAPRMRGIVAKYVKQKKGLLNGLKEAGDLLLAESNKKVPVDTGWLKSSGFVLVE